MREFPRRKFNGSSEKPVHNRVWTTVVVVRVPKSEARNTDPKIFCFIIDAGSFRINLICVPMPENDGALGVDSGGSGKIDGLTELIAMSEGQMSYGIEPIDELNVLSDISDNGCDSGYRELALEVLDVLLDPAFMVADDVDYLCGGGGLGYPLDKMREFPRLTPELINHMLIAGNVHFIELVVTHAVEAPSVSAEDDDVRRKLRQEAQRWN